MYGLASNLQDEKEKKRDYFLVEQCSAVPMQAVAGLSAREHPFTIGTFAWRD
jgi:hypothetical protein